MARPRQAATHKDTLMISPYEIHIPAERLATLGAKVAAYD